jgi:hypothetical protein
MRAAAVGGIAAALVLGGCASGGTTADSPFGGADRAREITIEVQNMNFSDARLYAIRDGQRLSIGMVGGKQNATLRVPWDFNQQLRIEMNLLAGPTCVTEALPVDAGDVLELQIPGVFGRSSICAR